MLGSHKLGSDTQQLLLIAPLPTGNLSESELSRYVQPLEILRGMPLRASLSGLLGPAFYSENYDWYLG